MSTKTDLIKHLQKNPKRHWKVKLFDEFGFNRRQCEKCKKFFWTLTDQKTCNDAGCRPYDFIGNPPTKKPFSYFETWKVIEKFFTKNNHISLKPYPVIPRWFPNLHFTIAGIVDFYRMDNGNMTFEFPANPSILLQPCLRFNDIPNTGINGKSFTCFNMIQQTSLYNGKEGYWKDECIDLDFRLLTQVFGIKQEEIVFIEDAWLGPNAFGSSLEYHVQGLELGNAVFTEFLGTMDNYTEMKNKIIDMGAGFERFVWISNGTPTSYDVTFGDVIKKLIKTCGVEYDKNFFLKYSKLSGGLNIDEVSGIREARKGIADKLGVSVKELEQKVVPIESIYALADHTRALLFAIGNGGLPSNVAGGYNLRVILRRTLDFIDKFKWDLKLDEVMEWHAKFLKPLFPDIKEGLENADKIISLEKERYKSTKENAKRILTAISEKKEKLDEQKIIQLYESQGISPEAAREITGADIPEDIYSKITARHEKAEAKKEQEIDVKGLPNTDMLFYKDSQQKEFTAKVIKVVDRKRVILNKTPFYPRSGGQDCDTGMINNCKVYNVEKIGGVVVHDVEKPSFRQGDTVRGIIDWDRREQLTKHHTSIHIINGVARKILGKHIWQAGSNKTTEKAHLDVTHYQAITSEETDKIELEANRMIKKGLDVKVHWMPRNEAEQKHGFTLYQGGAVPSKDIRIVEVKGLDTEACGGLHRTNTKEIEQIIITANERIQDGIDRITVKAGPEAKRYLEFCLGTANNLIDTLSNLGIKLPDNFSKKLTGELAFKELQKCAGVFSVSVEQLKKTMVKFFSGIKNDIDEINKLKEKTNQPAVALQEKQTGSLKESCEYIFSFWKNQRKELEKLRKEFAGIMADKLISKAKDKQVFDVISADRKGLIEVANELIEKDNELTVILTNHLGDIIGMSRTKDSDKIIKDICSRAGGSGGGNKQLAQGKVELSKLLKVMDKFKY